MKLKLYHHLLMDEPILPTVMPAPLVYVFAGNGVFLWAKREGLEVLIPVQPCPIRDLFPVEPFVRLDGLPRVASRLLVVMLVTGSWAQREDGTPIETLFFASLGENADWSLWRPPQQQAPMRVTPELSWLDRQDYAQVLMEIHTHPLPNMAAFFSSIDDADEQQGFRLYGVIGRIEREQGRIEAEIRLRVGVYGVFYEFPASWVLDMPEGLREVLPHLDDVGTMQEGVPQA